MANSIPQPPTSFNLQAVGDRWFHWKEIEKCFWPGQGRRAATIDPVLAPARCLGGVYLLAWASEAPDRLQPSHRAVCYVGETGDFCDRMDRFRTSAGFRGARADGHSAGWRWPKGAAEHLWVSFFAIGTDLLPHLANGLRCWMEAVAQEEYRVVHGVLPPLNVAQKGEITLETIASAVKS